MKRFSWLLPIGFLLALALQCRPIGPPGGRPDPWQANVSQATRTTPVSTGAVSTSALMREVNLKVDMVAKGSHGRKVVRPMKPRYITIHSTQNYSADAERHSLALKRGALRAPKRKGGNRIGYMIWHFTTDDRVAIQHMPTSEQGEHADFDGPGNRYSIGIEMCEHRGSSRAATVDRTAKLTAYLMVRNNIPLRNVVPHYHWPRRGKTPANKNCPHYLLDNGKPGPKWRAFLGKVDYHHKRLVSQQMVAR